MSGAIPYMVLGTGTCCAKCRLLHCHCPAGIPWHSRSCHVPSWTKAREGMHRVLCPGGILAGHVSLCVEHPHHCCDPTPQAAGVWLCCVCPCPQNLLPLGPLSPVSFVDCGESHHAAFLPDDTRFKVSRDGVVSATRPLQLQRREITFTVHTWDAVGKKHSAKVTLRQRWHQHRHHERMQQVKDRPTPWGHSSPCPWCRGLSKVLALSRATVPTGHSARHADFPGAWTRPPAAEEGLGHPPHQLPRE